jgi:hypothetical protein
MALAGSVVSAGPLPIQIESPTLDPASPLTPQSASPYSLHAVGTSFLVVFSVVQSPNTVFIRLMPFSHHSSTANRPSSKNVSRWRTVMSQSPLVLRQF